jgi:hypothetical protein
VSAYAQAKPLFPNPATPVSLKTFGLAAADLDEDGWLDLVVGHRYFEGIYILIGGGDGTFAPPVYYPTLHQAPWTVTVGDFNEDGHMDVAAGYFSSDGIIVFMGNGDGTLDGGTGYDNGLSAIFITTGDFNGDDHVDLITTWGDTGLFLGRGDGTFSELPPLSAGSTSVAVEDFNGDGFDDFALPVAIYLSNGDGTFDSAGSFPAGDQPFAVAAGDLDDDDIPDLAVINQGSDDLSVLLGNGDGTFGPEQRYSLAPGDPDIDPWAVAIADLDNDGLQDLAVTNWWGNSPPEPALSVLFGTGGGQFADAVTADMNAGANPALVIEDFDGDGAKDVVRSNWWDVHVDMLLGRGDGTFVTVEHLSVGEVWHRDVVASDLDGDGRVDLAIAMHESQDVSVLLADGAGTFSPEQRSCVVDAVPPCPPGSDPARLAVGEMTGDAHADLAVANAASDTVSILAGDGAGGFSFASSLTLTAGTSPSSIAIGDLDNDDEPDLVVVGEGSRRLGVFLGNGDGTFVPPPGFPTVAGTNPTAVALGTLDGDAHLDVVVANAGSDDVTVLLGDGDGTFTSAPTVADGSEPLDVAVGDVNGDQILDLAVANDGANTLHVHLGNGDGSFGAPTVLETTDVVGSGFGPYSVLIADLDGDERMDLAANTDVLEVFPGNGDGTFDAPHFYVGTIRPVAADFNLDARLDIAGPSVNSVGIMLNQGGPDAFTFLADHATLVWPAVTGALSYDIYRGETSVLIDGDDDGLPDSGYGACMTALDDDPRDTFFVDADTPSVGEGFFYLMSVIDALGDGGIGTTSAGLPRLPEVPCP